MTRWKRRSGSGPEFVWEVNKEAGLFICSGATSRLQRAITKRPRSSCTRFPRLGDALRPAIVRAATRPKLREVDPNDGVRSPEGGSAGPEQRRGARHTGRRLCATRRGGTDPGLDRPRTADRSGQPQHALQFRLRSAGDLGDKDGAINMLQSTLPLAGALSRSQYADTDPDLDSIRDDPRVRRDASTTPRAASELMRPVPAHFTRAALMILIGGSSIWPFIAPSPLVGRDRRGEDLADDVHALGHVTERGEAVGVAAAASRRSRACRDSRMKKSARAVPGPGVRHRDCAGDIVKAGLAASARARSADRACARRCVMPPWISRRRSPACASRGRSSRRRSGGCRHNGGSSRW